MKILLKVLDKLYKKPTCINPIEAGLTCKYNKGWNDAITKVEELITSYNLSDMWIPVDVKLPPEPDKNVEFCDFPDYAVTIKGAELSTSLTYIGNGRFVNTWGDELTEHPVVAWMPMPEVYKERKHE